MGFGKRLKRLAAKAVKVVAKTAPLWSNFIPGGSIAGKLLGHAGTIGSGLRAARRGGQQFSNPDEDLIEHEMGLANSILRRRGTGGGFRGVPASMRSIRQRRGHRQRRFAGRAYTHALTNRRWMLRHNIRRM